MVAVAVLVTIMAQVVLVVGRLAKVMMVAETRAMQRRTTPAQVAAEKARRVRAYPLHPQPGLVAKEGVIPSVQVVTKHASGAAAALLIMAVPLVLAVMAAVVAVVTAVAQQQQLHILDQVAAVALTAAWQVPGQQVPGRIW